MTDRELLELAAKAAGLKIDKSETNGGGIGNTGFDMIGNAVLNWHNYITWSPLTDDGDALRLAVKLRIDVGFLDDYGLVRTGFDVELLSEPLSLDENAATRRAIVRAAAEIGRAMP